MNTSRQRELKHLQDAVHSKPEKQHRSWVLMAAGAVVVVGMAFLAMLYVGWSANLADSTSPLVDASVARHEDTPVPTLAATDMAANSASTPATPAEIAEIPQVDANGIPVISESNLGDYSLEILRKTTKSMTVTGDIQSCLAAIGATDPIRAVQQVNWQSSSSNSSVESWLIVTSKTTLADLQSIGGEVQSVIMPLECANLPTGEAVASADAAVPTSYFLSKFSVPPGLSSETGVVTQSGSTSPR
ncbi:hypothetical protein JT358_07840 [Micrococcales bacterium 31B]|nr:hypothetical protein [Micrococcales bacterium 31B]